MRIQTVGFQTIFNLLAQVLLNGTNFVLIMLFTRLMPTDDYGIVSIYQAYVLFFSSVVGLNTQGSIGTAFVHYDVSEHRDYLASAFFLGTLSLLAILISSALFFEPLESFSQLSPILIVLVLFHSFGSYAFSFASIKYVYSRKAQRNFALAAFLSLSIILFSWIGINQKVVQIPSYMARILGLALPYIICGIYVTLTVFIQGNPFKNLRRYWTFCLPISIPLILHGLSQVLLSQTDKIMLQKALGDYSLVGIYSFIVTFVHILNSIYIALNNTWVPIYYGYLQEGDDATLIKRGKRYCNLFTYLVVGFLMVSPEFIKTFADKNYWSGISLVPIVTISIYMTYAYSFAVNFELYHRTTRLIAAGTTAAAICNIGLNALLIPSFHIYGAAIGTMISYILLFVFHGICAAKVDSERYQFTWSFYSKNIIIMSLFCILFYLFKDIWYVRWGLAVLDGILLLRNVYRHKSLF